MKNGKLILHPALPDVVPESIAGLLQRLQDIGFLASPLERTSASGYLAGDRFLQLITFLGCSPQIELKPAADSELDFCHISLSGPSANVQFVFGDMTKPPRCPRCGAKDTAWKRMLAVWRANPADFTWTCPSCGAASAFERLDWRRGAGSGRFFLVVHGVFPGEAVPGEELLRSLEAITDNSWAYFYVTGSEGMPAA